MATENTDLVRKIKNPRRILYVILALIALISLPIVKMALSESQSKRDRQRSMSGTINQAPSNGSGILVITKHAWRGVAVPPHMTIKVWSITTNVVRRVQVNEDPNRETPVYPDSNKIVLGDDLRYVAWKIQDDQLVSEAKIGYQFIPL